MSQLYRIQQQQIQQQQSQIDDTIKQKKQESPNSIFTLKKLRTALPFIKDGIQFVFHIVSDVKKLKPKQQADVTTGYQLQDLPPDHALQLRPSEQCHHHKKFLFGLPKLFHHKHFGKQIGMRLFNAGDQDVDLKRGHGLFRGVLKKILFQDPQILLAEENFVPRVIEHQTQKQPDQSLNLKHIKKRIKPENFKTKRINKLNKFRI